MWEELVGREESEDRGKVRIWMAGDSEELVENEWMWDIDRRG